MVEFDEPQLKWDYERELWNLDKRSCALNLEVLAKLIYGLLFLKFLGSLRRLM